MGRPDPAKVSSPRLALYARYSTHNQSVASIEDQLCPGLRPAAADKTIGARFK